MQSFCNPTFKNLEERESCVIMYVGVVKIHACNITERPFPKLLFFIMHDKNYIKIPSRDIDSCNRIHKGFL